MHNMKWTTLFSYTQCLLYLSISLRCVLNDFRDSTNDVGSYKKNGGYGNYFLYIREFFQPDLSETRFQQYRRVAIEISHESKAALNKMHKE